MRGGMLIQNQWSNNSMGLQSSWLLGDLPRSSPGSLPEILHWGPTLAFKPHSLGLCVPSSRSNQSRISTQDPDQTFPYELVYYHTVDFSEGEEDFPRALPGPPTTRFPRSWGSHPCLPTPDLGHPQLRCGKLLQLMQPGCFRFAFAPSSSQLG